MLHLDSPYLEEGAVSMHLNFSNMDYNMLHCISDRWYSIRFAIMVDLKFRKKKIFFFVRLV